MTRFIRAACLGLMVAALFAAPLLETSNQALAQNSNRTQKRRSRKPVKRDAVFIGGGAQTGAVVNSQTTATTSANLNANRSSAIIGGGAGTGARVANANSTGLNQPNAAIGAGGAGTYLKSKRRTRRRQ